MNRTFPCRDHRDTTRGPLKAAAPGACRSGRPQLRRGLRRLAAAWTWLLVLIVVAALAANGCGGGGEPEPDPEPPSSEPPPETKPTAKPKPKEEAKLEEEKPLPEEISEWVKEDYYRARKEQNERLPEAVAYLGQHFAGTENADAAAGLLTNLLKKSDEPAPKKAPAGGRPSRYRGADDMYSEMDSEEMYSEMDAEEEMYSEMDSEEMYSEMDAEEEMYSEMDEEEMYSDESGMEEYDGSGPPRGYRDPSGRYAAPGRMGSMSAGRAGFVGALIKAVVSALGVNDSQTARKTLSEVVEGTFETDDNRVATLATLETFVAHLCPEYEDVLYRCLTEPEKMRALGRQGRSGGPSRGPMAYTGGMYPSGRGGSGQGPLTAEELQRQAFSLFGPQAPQEFRAKLADHLAKPDTPQEDVDLFGDYLCESDPENVSAQMVLYVAKAIDAQTKEIVEENFLAFSSDALAGILGVPVDQRVRRADRRRRGRGPGMGQGYMDDGGMYSEEEMYSEEMEEEMYSEEMEEEMYSEEEMMGPSPSYPGASRPRGARGSGRPSRYDSQATGGRPSRYDPGQAAGQAPAEEPDRPDPDLPYRLASQMWAAQMSKLVEGRLSQLDSLDSGANLVLLASTMPVDSTRSTLHQMLQQRWEDGPGALESAGLLDEVVSDPGFLVLVKMLPFKPPAEPTTPRPSLNRMRRGGRPGYGDQYRSDEGGPSDEMYSDEMESGAEEYGAPGMRPGARQRQTSQDPNVAWAATSEELVRVLCERLLAAARGTGGAGQSQGEMPVEVRADANVVAEYHLDWPGAGDQKLSGVPLGQLKVHYLRAEMDTRLSTLESFYRRKLTSVEERSIHNGSWMQSLATVPDTDTKRSIDLMFTATVPAGEQLDKKQELPVTLDVLCIDIKDPRSAAAGN